MLDKTQTSLALRSLNRNFPQFVNGFLKQKHQNNLDISEKAQTLSERRKIINSIVSFVFVYIQSVG
jgi:hypothetical protein